MWWSVTEEVRAVAQRKRDGTEADGKTAVVLPAWLDVTDELGAGTDPLRQRVAFFGRIERVTHEGLLDVIRQASESRVEAERTADALLRRQRAACAQLAEQVEALQRERAQLPDELERGQRNLHAELAARRSTIEAECERERAQAEHDGQRLRAEVQEEVARERARTQAQVEELLGEARARRAAVTAELQALEAQVEQVRQMMDVFVHRRIQTLRGNLASQVSSGGTGSGNARIVKGNGTSHGANGHYLQDGSGGVSSNAPEHLG